MSKKIIITGATGLIGKKLAQKLISRGDEVIIFSRDENKSKRLIPGAKEYVKWDYRKIPNWQNKIEGADGIVHLAGVNLFSKRWNSEFKKEIIQSRTLSTRSLIEAIRNSNRRPGFFICASGVGIYGDRKDELLNEGSLPGNDFLSEVCLAWEEEAKKAEDYGLRRVSIRTAIVLSKEDGALKQMLLPFKFFIGGPLGSGRQFFPWLHIDDIVGIYLHAIDTNNLYGSLNAASPEHKTMKEFATTLGKVLKRPALFSVPAFALKIAVGESASAVLSGQKINSQKLLKSGYKFNFLSLEDALKDLLTKTGK
jgi:hypothetical protein